MISQEDIRQLINDVAEIKTAIVGNSKLGIEGLSKRVDSLEKWRTKLNLRIAFWSGAGTLIVFLAKAGLDFLSNHK